MEKIYKEFLNKKNNGLLHSTVEHVESKALNFFIDKLANFGERDFLYIVSGDGKKFFGICHSLVNKFSGTYFYTLTFGPERKVWMSPTLSIIGGLDNVNKIICHDNEELQKWFNQNILKGINTK